MPLSDEKVQQYLGYIRKKESLGPYESYIYGKRERKLKLKKFTIFWDIWLLFQMFRKKCIFGCTEYELIIQPLGIFSSKEIKEYEVIPWTDIVVLDVQDLWEKTEILIKIKETKEKKGKEVVKWNKNLLTFDHKLRKWDSDFVPFESFFGSFKSRIGKIYIYKDFHRKKSE